MHRQEGPTAAMSPYRDAGMTGDDVSARPRDGDVMITKESRPSSWYTARQLPDNGQIRAESLDDAVQLARGFAQARAVNVWYSDSTTLRLLEAYRSCNERGSGTNRPGH